MTAAVRAGAARPVAAHDCATLSVVDVLVVDHPLAQSRLTAMRDARTDSGSFRAALNELATMLVYEAARAFAVQRYPIDTPIEQTEGTRLLNPPLIVPVLRAGLGMADAALALLPESSMGFVGLARDEHTFQPRAYLESLPVDLTELPVLVLDPMLATGGSLEHCCRLLVDRGATDITVCVCWPHRRASNAWPDPGCRCAWSPRRSIASSTTRCSSCRALATQVTASSAACRASEQPDRSKQPDRSNKPAP